MINKYKFLPLTLTLLCSVGVIAEEVPIIELNTRDTTAPNFSNRQTGTSRNTDIFTLVQQLQDEVRNLRGIVEQQNYRINKMEQLRKEQYRDLDRRISARSQNSGLESNPSQETSNNGWAKPPKSPILVQPPVNSDDSTAYRDAFSLVRQRKYNEAIKAFSKFIADYPNSQRIPNAYYWLGEVHLAQQKPKLAEDFFIKVVTLFGNHRKAPDAAYKLGIIYDQLGDRKKSDEFLDLVINKYPESSAIKLAKEYKQLR